MAWLRVEIIHGLNDALLALLALSAVNVSVPEEMDGKLTKQIIEEYGLKSSASMVQDMQMLLLGIWCTYAISNYHNCVSGPEQKA